MAEEETIADFDSNAALLMIKTMWLDMGKTFSILATSNDWADTPEDTGKAMQWALQAEACLWRATGECQAADVSVTAPGVSPND